MATHDAIWLKEGDQKRSAVQRLFADLAPSYDRFNGLVTLSLHHRWRDRAVAELAPLSGDAILDLCCGTGDFFHPLRRLVGPNGEIIGIDFCMPMLEHAAIKHVEGDLTCGDAIQLPLKSASVNGVTVGWGMRNVPDIDATHQEIFRVLKPGGRFVSLDTARPKNRFIRSVSEFTFAKMAPIIGGRLGFRKQTEYLPQSTKRFWDRQRLARSMREAGFTDIRIVDLAFGNIALHIGVKPVID